MGTFCLYVCMCTIYLTDTLWGQRRASDSLGLELWVVPRCSVSLENRMWSSVRTASTLDHWGIFPVPWGKTYSLSITVSLLSTFWIDFCDSFWSDDTMILLWAFSVSLIIIPLIKFIFLIDDFSWLFKKIPYYIIHASLNTKPLCLCHSHKVTCCLASWRIPSSRGGCT